MADNTLLNPAPLLGGGDLVRTLARSTGASVPSKTEVVQLDFGGQDASPESLVSVTNPLPVAPPLAPTDADGVPLVNVGAPSADVATASRQGQIIDAVLGPVLNPAGPATVAVGIASVVVVALNPGRRGLVLTNTSTAGQTISFNLSGGLAVALSGLVLWPGDVFEMDRYTFVTGTINGIASAAAASVAVQEFN